MLTLSQQECVNTFAYVNSRKVSAHPTEKPLAFVERVVAVSSDPGDLVVDPFAGSGTTLVAAQALGRSFLGWGDTRPRVIPVPRPPPFERPPPVFRPCSVVRFEPLPTTRVHPAEPRSRCGAHWANYYRVRMPADARALLSGGSCLGSCLLGRALPPSELPHRGLRDQACGTRVALDGRCGSLFADVDVAAGLRTEELGMEILRKPIDRAQLAELARRPTGTPRTRSRWTHHAVLDTEPAIRGRHERATGLTRRITFGRDASAQQPAPPPTDRGQLARPGLGRDGLIMPFSTPRAHFAEDTNVLPGSLGGLLSGGMLSIGFEISAAALLARFAAPADSLVNVARLGSRGRGPRGARDR
ncbi:MAG: DNA methyltransferase [Planctomycetota bacterium]